MADASRELFKFGNVSFKGLIRAETYEITPNARQDLDSYRDAQGILRRTALGHTATVIEFDVKMLNEQQMSDLLTGMRDAYINPNERDAQCTYFDPETNTWNKTGHFYLDSNFKVTLYALWERGGVIYKDTHFKFVEY